MLNPSMVMNAWVLLFGVSQAVAPPPPAEFRERVELAWSATVPGRSGGYGVVLGGLGAPSDWTEPNLADALGVGFDVRNPKTDNPFNADGNLYGRPEREVSLHWRGREVANRRSPVDLRSGAPVRVRIDAVVGGAEVTVQVGGSRVYDRFLIPGLRPLAAAPRWGGLAQLSGLTHRATGRRVAAEAPVRVSAFRRELNDASRHTWSATADFRSIPASVGRVIATLRLDPTPAGLDPWDRLAQIWIVDDQGQRYDLVRYITPYRRAWEWTLDVTEMLPLFRGQRTLEGRCETYGAGWLVSLDLDFYPGRLTPAPFAVQNLWNGEAVLGQASRPVTEFFRPIPLTPPPGTRRAVVRTLVTGHGMDPNARNAAEFLPLWRELGLGNARWRTTLWKDDNDLNPCRPQGGTWKYDRAGWAPGDVVEPWLVDITRALGKSATPLTYTVEPYENPTPVEGNPARHVVGSQVIYYR